MSMDAKPPREIVAKPPRDRAQKLLLLIYTEYNAHLPTHVLLEIRQALWPGDRGPGPSIEAIRFLFDDAIPAA